MKLSESLMATNAVDSKHYDRDQKWQAKGNAVAADRYTLQTPNRLSVNVDNIGYAFATQSDLDLSATGTWDQVVTDYRVAATRAGKDFYVYACQQDNVEPKILISANSTYPDGYTADNSRKLGGFHCLCVSVGTIAGHTLTDYVVGDILPQSVWDLLHRPNENAPTVGMVYAPEINKWVAIYLASGTGVSTTSVYEGTISDNRSWMDFVDDFRVIGCRLLSDCEFMSAATGSNEETNIAGSVDPVTAGGHSDTAARRMISNIGCEECCGVEWQWLTSSSVKLDDGTADTLVDLPEAKGSFYTYGTNGYGNTQLIAGGAWSNGAYCGSRSRSAHHYRWYVHTDFGARAVAEPL